MSIQTPAPRSSAFTAAVFSMLIPGLGQAYQRRWHAALLFVSPLFLITALVAGYEVGLRIGIAAKGGMFARGYHNQGTTGAFVANGSVVNITTDSERYNGVYTVMDTGPKVQGRQLDLYIWSCTEALQFGRQRGRVTILRMGWDPKATPPGLIDRVEGLFKRPDGTQPPRRLP